MMLHLGPKPRPGYRLHKIWRPVKRPLSRRPSAKVQVVCGVTRKEDARAVAVVDVFDYLDGILRDAKVPHDAQKSRGLSHRGQ